jgi:3-carboxy-cis,cis-muconate cycloisomerase
MKPSSSSSEAGLFSAVFARGAARVDDAAWVEAMLEVEAALARALATARVVTPGSAAAVSRAVRIVAGVDPARLGAAAGETGTPVLSLVEAIGASAIGAAAADVHRGATSQDVIDTAMMLLAKRAGATLLQDLAAAAAAAAGLADRHRRTLMVGRTLLQHAVPVTFGLKAAGWLTAIDEARAALDDIVQEHLPVQFGGAAGTLASLGDRGVTVAKLLARELGLAVPVLPWHTHRLALFALGSALAGVALTLGKMARDVTLLAQSEVAEVSEGGHGRGASSTMPNKRNPVASVAILGCTRRVPGLLATLAAAGEQEHERAAGAWHAEWETFSDLVRLVGSAAAWSRELLENLEVHPERMKRNLDAGGGEPMAERLSALLAGSMGRLPALDLVRRAVARARQSQTTLADALFDDGANAAPLARAGLNRATVTDALDAAAYLGSAELWIDRALAAHEALQSPAATGAT